MGLSLGIPLGYKGNGGGQGIVTVFDQFNHRLEVWGGTAGDGSRSRVVTRIGIAPRSATTVAHSGLAVAATATATAELIKVDNDIVEIWLRWRGLTGDDGHLWFGLEPKWGFFVLILQPISKKLCSGPKNEFSHQFGVIRVDLGMWVFGQMALLIAQGPHDLVVVQGSRIPRNEMAMNHIGIVPEPLSGMTLGPVNSTTSTNEAPRSSLTISVVSEELEDALPRYGDNCGEISPAAPAG